MTRKTSQRSKTCDWFVEDSVGGGYPSPGVKGFTIPLPSGAANYGEAVKQVPWDVTPPSTVQNSYVRVPECTYPLFALPGESFGHFSERALHHLVSKESDSILSGRSKTPDNRGRHPASQSNPYTVLDGVDMDGCTQVAQLKKKAETLVKWFRRMGNPQTGDLPARIECGGLRSAVRQCFPEVDELWELSFKTIQKVEKNCCSKCEPRFRQRLSEWMEQRFQPVEVDQSHLEQFKRCFRLNVETGWDQERRPFIPNGNATLGFKRRCGGNWNFEEFSDKCRPELVFSSGKPRVVTLYSARNTELLGPLHYSLYEILSRKGWLLVGDPTDKDIGRLTGTRYLSFDYQSATDNIKTAYVEAAVEILIEKATSLTDDEIRALRVLSALQIEGRDGVATRGQPMGSVMSFPLLCLINKTVVDLALTTLLERKEISFREWSGHPCLINGDDLLTREPRKNTDLRSEISRHGNLIGLVVNQEKTMESDLKAEINSTLFVSGQRQRKVNASSLWMKPDVNDVLGLAAESTFDRRSFVKVVRANAHILSKQQDKFLSSLPAPLQRACRKDRKIRRACTSLPESVRPVREGVIRMVERPEGYSLSREEEYATMVEEISRVREMGIQRCSQGLPKFRTSFVPNAQSYSKALRRRVSIERELIPKCYAQRFNLKLREDLVSQELAPLRLFEDPPFDGPRIAHLVDLIRAGRSPLVTKEVATPVASDFVEVE